MSQIPDSLIGTVPAAIVDAAMAHRDSGIVEFNVATWLSLPGLAELPVSLLVSYVDGRQQREIMVDHSTINSYKKVMLSGIARLPVKQRIEDMQIRLRCAVTVKNLIVEELFVQPVELPGGQAKPAFA
ncbi:hypothetical protein [Pseudomonas sp. LRF_L74]|uniref:hypothetical protein n=1 Tax=Pseudomonas sp. LRF_L74 TaxID=3369422 RepID=UPI003F5E8EFB